LIEKEPLNGAGTKYKFDFINVEVFLNEKKINPNQFQMEKEEEPEFEIPSNFSFDVDGPKALQVSGIAPWMVVVMLGRELLVTSIRAMLEGEGKDFSASTSGKAKMIVQACAIPAILILLGITDVVAGTWGRVAIDVIAWATVFVTVISGVPYVTRGMKMLGK
jgi:hypothetical protein